MTDENYKVWIEVEKYNDETDEYTKGLQLDAGSFATEKEANDHAVMMFEATG